MDKLDYFKKRYEIYYEYFFKLLNTDFSRNYYKEQKKRVEKASYENGEIKYLRLLDKAISQDINDLPKEMRLEVNKLMEDAFGVDTGALEKKREGQLKTIIKRGFVKTREEYELVNARIDELISNKNKGEIDANTYEKEAILLGNVLAASSDKKIKE